MASIREVKYGGYFVDEEILDIPTATSRTFPS